MIAAVVQVLRDDMPSDTDKQAALSGHALER